MANKLDYAFPADDWFAAIETGGEIDYYPVVSWMVRDKDSETPTIWGVIWGGSGFIDATEHVGFSGFIRSKYARPDTRNLNEQDILDYMISKGVTTKDWKSMIDTNLAKILADIRAREIVDDLLGL